MGLPVEGGFYLSESPHWIWQSWGRWKGRVSFLNRTLNNNSQNKAIRVELLPTPTFASFAGWKDRWSWVSPGMAFLSAADWIRKSDVKERGVWSGTSGCKSSTTASYQILFKFNKPGGGRVRSVAGLRFFIGQSNVGHGRRRPEEKQGMEIIRSMVCLFILIRADLREA